VIDKAKWLALAEVIDRLRVFPRAFLGAQFVWTVIVVDRTLTWYFHLPLEQQTIQASGLASVIVSAVTGIFVQMFARYATTGQDWPSPPSGGTTP